MAEAQAADHPPLWVWIAASLLAAISLFVLSQLWKWVDLPDEPADAYTLNLGRLGPTVTGEVQVVVIGTSKTLAAVEFDQALTAPLDKTVLRFHRITWNGANYLQLQPAFEALDRHPPRLLLIESDLLVFDRSLAPAVDMIQSPVHAGLRLAGQTLKHLAGFDGHNASANRGVGRAFTAAECQARTRPEALAAYARAARLWQVSDDTRRARFLNRLRKLKRSGTKVVMLDIPRSPQADTAVPVDIESRAKQLSRELSTAEGFEVWRAPLAEDSDYCDQGHLSGQGRQRVSHWLRSRLADLAASQGG
ncbi:MAG: hypothetical protein ACT4PZ_19920 [Panacagrimonas sp.]